MFLVGFSTPSWFNPLSLFIRWVTGSRASHAWILFTSSDLKVRVVLEAHELGFRQKSWKHFRRFNKVVALYDPRRPINLGVQRVARDLMDTGYDYLGLFGMAVVRLGKWFKRKWKNPFRSPGHVFCSEALALAMQWSPGYADFTDDADTMDPEGLLSYFSADGSMPVDAEKLSVEVEP